MTDRTLTSDLQFPEDWEDVGDNLMTNFELGFLNFSLISLILEKSRPLDFCFAALM